MRFFAVIIAFLFNFAAVYNVCAQETQQEAQSKRHGPCSHCPVDTVDTEGTQGSQDSHGVHDSDKSHTLHGSTANAGHHGQDHNHDHDRPDIYGPIGVMGSHVHQAGTWMPSYRFMYMDMRGNRDGTHHVSTGDVLDDFMVSPTNMQVEKHVFGAMYSLTDDFTVMAMFPYIRKSMRHVNRMGVRFTTRSDGIGDFKLMPLYAFFRRGGHSLHLNAGVSLPTGSIHKSDDTPAGPDRRLPYPMQLGSGTFDLLPGVTYLGQTESWSWGVQPMGTIRLGENSNDYTLGNRFNMTAWGSRVWTDWLSTSLRIDGQVWRNIRGDDPKLNPRMVPTADPDRRAGERVDILFGVNLYAPEGKLKGNMLSAEGGFPVYQSLDGPQLETDWRLTVGWRWAF